MKLASLDLSDKQIEILEKLALNTIKVPTLKSKGILGLSESSLGKHGFCRGTFANNRDSLLKRHLIRIVHHEIHGLQTWTYYDITPLGLIALLKQEKIKNILKKFRPSLFSRFFPLIGIHWDELSEFYGESLVIFLKKAIDQIKIEEIRSLAKNKKGELTEFGFLEQIVSINFNDLSLSLPMHPILVSATKEFFSSEQKINTSGVRLQKVLTFLFYFNIINIHHDKNILIYFFDTFGEPDIIDEKGNYSMKLMGKMLSVKQQEILSIIDRNGELNSLMKNITNEIDSKFIMPYSIQYLKKTLIKN